MSAAQLPPGTVIDGRYTLGDVVRSRLGAIVYAATDGEGNAADVTVYGADCFPSALVRERSLRELRQLQGVDSPRIVSVLGCGKRDDGGAYEVTAPMRDPLVTEAVGRGAWPEADAAALLVQVGEALLVAQKVGVIHRNLGPTVIHAGPSGACLGGFAVGEPQGEGAFGPTMTIAPEQVEGKIVDQRTLIFNLAALMQTMLAGASPYQGQGIGVLRAYVQSEPDASTHPGLKRALGRDPRMRPMMLRQFLGELGAIGGVAGPSTPSVSGPAPAAPAGATPTSRGWTMFMKDDAPEAPTPAGGSAEPAAPVAAPAGAKPSTRGWTMFMEAADDDPPPKKEETAPAPAPVAEAKPSTRGWTMFMEAADDEAEPQPAETAKPAAPAPEAPGDKPSTRGWTMFMEAAEGDGADAATPASEAPTGPEQAAAAATASAESAAVQGQTQIAATPDAKGGPSTRGWTMFMEDEEPEGDPAAAEPASTGAPSAAPAATPAPAPAATPSAAPASSGWTMFKEPSEPMPPLEAEAPAAAAPAAPEPTPATAAPAAAAAPIAAASPAAAAAPADSDADKPAAKKRGWTMFMEAPIPRQGDDKTIGGPKRVDPPGGSPRPAEPSPGASPRPAEPSPATAATQKGWTVFGAEAELGKRVAEVQPASPPASQPASQLASQLAAEAPAPQPSAPAGPATTRPRISTVVSNPNIAEPAEPSADVTMPAPGSSPDVTIPAPGAAAPLGVAEAQSAGAKTVIATGLDARAGAAGGVTSRAELPGASDAPSGPAGGIAAPNAIAARPSAPIAKPSSNKGVFIAVAAVVVVGGAVAAWFLS